MKKRLSISLILIIVASIVISSIFIIIGYSQRCYSDTEKSIKESSNYIVNYILPTFLETENSKALDDYVSSTKMRITITNIQGDVTYESTPGLEDEVNHISRPEIVGAMAGNTTTEIRYSNTLKVKMIYVATPYYDANNTIEGVLRVAMPVSSINTVIFEMVEKIILIIMMTIFTTTLVIPYLINRELKPLDEASAFARKIASGKYGQQLTMIRKDKIGELVESLNQMSLQLNDSFSEMNRKNAELTSILSSMNHGIIAIDEKNKIIHLNDAARKILDISKEEKVVKKNILEVYRESFILELMEHLKNEECERMSFESRIHPDQIVRVYINRIVENNKFSNGHIIILEDITLLKSLENMRRDFIANVSHELKTPITTIKGFIETIQVNKIDDPETLDHFYSIISEESDRLSRLVSDILVLSQLENKSGFEKKAECLRLDQEIAQIFDILKLSAEEKKISMRLFCEKPITLSFMPDEFRQMMINLIDNAIKYSEPQKAIEVILTQDDEEVRIEVRDQGYGIPTKDIDRIFERFYRVDKSRSKEKGGTGLGLAIVKHIIYNNHGKIEVNSKLGKGTTFIIHLPKTRN
ncbi:PAS domain-containing protein [Acetobacterium paludosum]|uniref:histidine kinase n=1 Tax=Acetobacterium paludosum TaxID=52693 RepID=A0A923HWE7_9FIRM|nr:ATP-binding protein [Acetobacterium paludosum]MBC3889754.1 PAS domain-containing protein [Acetobacterium paludosum]